MLALPVGGFVALLVILLHRFERAMLARAS
jgi:hypothetical protein